MNTTDRKRLRILVVGAGIGGLGVARALRRHGFTADVVERQHTWQDTGAGIYLPGNATRALAALGLRSAVAERASLIPRQQLCDHRGGVLADIDMAALWHDVGPCLALHRADLHDILATHDQPVPVRMGTPVQDISQHHGTVTVGFGDGTVDRYDLVIGADGVHSTIRRLAFDRRIARPLGQLAWRFVTERPPDLKTWTVLLRRDVTFLAVPIGPGRVYGYCDTAARATTARPGETAIDQLAALLAGFAAPVPDILDTLRPNGAIHVGPIEEVNLDDWTRGSVLLIGDAAHATSPNMAEGAAMALEDGLVLAECLASQPDLEASLAAYQTRRRPRTRWVRAQTIRRDRTRNLPPTARNLILRRFGQHIFQTNYRPLRDPP
jgi:FAD-dependent urate hydroxylase